MILFDGKKTAQDRLDKLKVVVAQSSQVITVASILFTEDKGSVFYAHFKQKAAASVGIEYRLFPFSLGADISQIHETIRQLNADQGVCGIIVQKPTKRTWRQAWESWNKSGGVPDFDAWWTEVYSAVAVEKDVDGLHPKTLAAIADGSWQTQNLVLPATCQAVLDILSAYSPDLSQLGKYVIVGRSDLLGAPLASVLQQRGCVTDLIGKEGFAARAESGVYLKDARVVVSAVGVPHLIDAGMVAEGVVLIDGGEPQPDIDLTGMEAKAVFATPVPGGVGPMTVVCLLENAVRLMKL